MTHDELRDLSGGYALGILSEAERRAFEAHLPTCPECGEEVRGFAAVAQGLAQAVPLVDPPAALRDRVLAAATAAPHHAVEAAPPRAPRRVLAFLSAAAALVAFALGLYAATLQQRIRVLEGELRAASARQADSERRLVQYQVASDRTSQIRAILAAPDLRRIDLAGQKAAPGASGRAFWSPAQGLVVAFENLPATSPDRVYQLWVIPPDKGAAPISAALLDLQPDGRAIALGARASASRVGTVAVTLEPAGGVPAPTGNMIVAGALSN
jgi:anti-sigma-K factor RskA